MAKLVQHLMILLPLTRLCKDRMLMSALTVVSWVEWEVATGLETSLRRIDLYQSCRKSQASTNRMAEMLLSRTIHTRECMDNPQPNQVDHLQLEQHQNETNSMKNHGSKELRNPKPRRLQRVETKDKDKQVLELHLQEKEPRHS